MDTDKSTSGGGEKVCSGDEERETEVSLLCSEAESGISITVLGIVETFVGVLGRGDAVVLAFFVTDFEGEDNEGLAEFLRGLPRPRLGVSIGWAEGGGSSICCEDFTRLARLLLVRRFGRVGGSGSCVAVFASPCVMSLFFLGLPRGRAGLTGGSVGRVGALDGFADVKKDLAP